MKKLLALLLVLTMSVMAFSGCQTTAPASVEEVVEDVQEAIDAAPEAVTEAIADIEEAAEGDAGFVWNGQKEVWSVLPTTNAEGLIMINDAMGAILEEDGWTYVKKDAAGDPGKQVTFIEDAIAVGNVGAIMCAAMSVEMLQTVVEDANEAGIIVVYLGAEPTAYQIGSVVYTSYELTGMWAVEMAEEWAAQNNPPADDKGIPVALDVYEDIVDGRYRSNAFRDRTNESETLYIFNEGTTYGDNAQTEGYNWAENQMTANPDLRIFICYEPDCCYGVCEFLDTYAADNGVDLKEFCVICCYEDGDTPGYLEKAQADLSSTAFKGYVTYGDAGGPPTVGAKLAEEIGGIANGTWQWGTPYYDTITAWAAFTGSADAWRIWKMGDENPAAQYKY